MNPYGRWRLPAEWEDQSAVYLAWPKNPETWPGHLPEVQQTFLILIQTLTRHQTVRLIVESEATGQEIFNTSGFSTLANLEIAVAPYNDSWIRDTGPLYTSNVESPGNFLAHDFRFNAWGGKYEPWDEDDRLAEHILRHFPCPARRHCFVLEGGSIDSNGQGSLLTTEQCLLNPNRNPEYNQEAIDRLLKETFGCQRILWLGSGIEGDDTDGHVDDITRFVSPTRVLTVRASSRTDPNYQPLEENFRRLKCLGDQDGNPLEVIDIPLPDCEVSGPFGRCPASYANFFIANKQVLVPVFGAPNEESVLRVFSDCFPDREIVPIESRGLVAGLGAIHCLTKEQPDLSGVMTSPG